jgi:hypothetical protein
MESKDRDTIYVINKFDDFTTFSWRNKRVVLPYNVPVEIDFTDDPTLVSQLLQCPQLQVCTKKELASYQARQKAKAALTKVEPEEVVATDSEVENLLSEEEQKDA